MHLLVGDDDRSLLNLLTVRSRFLRWSRTLDSSGRGCSLASCTSCTRVGLPKIVCHVEGTLQSFVLLRNRPHLSRVGLLACVKCGLISGHCRFTKWHRFNVRAIHLTQVAMAQSTVAAAACTLCQA